MPRAFFLLTFLLLFSIDSAIPSERSPAEIRWYPSPGAAQAWSSRVPERAADPTPLLYVPDFPAVPSFSIPLLDGGRFESASARGKVVLLDFWASWCEPCLRAANGGLIPWQAGLASPLGRFLFVLGREVGVAFFGYGRDPNRLVIPTPGVGIGDATLIELKSIQVDFPFLEYRPFRTFSLNQSSSLAFQFYGGIDIPPSGPPSPRSGTRRPTCARPGTSGFGWSSTGAITSGDGRGAGCEGEDIRYVLC